MKVFVTGVNGQLGHDVMLELSVRGHEAIGSGSGAQYKGSDAVASMPYMQMDITDSKAVMETISAVRPDAIIHCSAWTAVDAAEDAENRDKVFALNVKGPENIAIACNANHSKLVYISTDYVFDGQGSEPWQPDSKNTSPLNVYGQSKLEGELAVARNTEKFFIVRTAWLFGANNNNFVRTMLRAGSKYDAVRVVNDQIGTPTYTIDLARLLADMVSTEKYGCYHATNEGGFISWYDFTKEIYRQAGLNTQVIPVTTAEYGLSKAARPNNSRLDKTKLTENGFKPLPDWRDALRRYLKETSYGTDSCGL